MYEKYILEKISFYKLWITLFVAMDASTTAWFFNNHSRVNGFKLFIVVLAIIFLTATVIIITRKAREMIKKLVDE